MPVSGLIITLSEQPHRRRQAIEALAGRPEITLGPPSDSRLPIVVDAADLDANADLWVWLNQLPGIQHVDLVSVNFEDSCN